MIRLYRSMEYPQMWIAYVPESGWTIFPAREHGWDERKPAHGLDPIHLREVPLSLAVTAGVKQPRRLAKVA